MKGRRGEVKSGDYEVHAAAILLFRPATRLPHMSSSRGVDRFPQIYTRPLSLVAKREAIVGALFGQGYGEEQ